MHWVQSDKANDTQHRVSGLVLSGGMYSSILEFCGFYLRLSLLYLSIPSFGVRWQFNNLA